MESRESIIFGEPLFGYYLASDEWVMRKHLQMLTDAGIDFTVFDTTNAVTYDKSKKISSKYGMNIWKWA